MPVHVLRYEDLRADPAGAFAAALRFLGDDPTPTRVAAAVEAARFERLQAFEAAQGFREHSRRATAPFFRSSRSGGWRDELTPTQARRVVADHAPTMRRLGYGALVAEIEAEARGGAPGAYLRDAPRTAEDLLVVHDKALSQGERRLPRLPRIPPIAALRGGTLFLSRCMRAPSRGSGILRGFIDC